MQSPSDDVTTVFPLPPAVVTLDDVPDPEWTVTEFPPVVEPETPFGPAVTELVMLPSPPLPLVRVSTCLQPSALSDDELDTDPPEDDEDEDEAD